MLVSYVAYAKGLQILFGTTLKNSLIYNKYYGQSKRYN